MEFIQVILEITRQLYYSFQMLCLDQNCAFLVSFVIEFGQVHSCLEC